MTHTTIHIIIIVLLILVLGVIIFAGQQPRGVDVNQNQQAVVTYSMI